VYRVDAAGEAFVLKIAAESESAADWHGTLQIQRLAAEHGLSPRVVHVDELGRAVLTAFVADRSFPAFYLDPRTRDAAIGELGRTVRRIHAIPLPAGAPVRDPRAFLARVSEGLLSGFAVPSFAGETIERMLAEDPPAGDGTLVLSHNDLNPSNLMYDGERILVLDWAAAGAAESTYDLAVVSVFLRMDEDASLHLLSAYDGAPAGVLPARFAYHRRLAATLIGAFQLQMARRLGHAGATGSETLASTLALGAFYQRMNSGAVRLGTAEGSWAFGLALIKEAQELGAALQPSAR
jgi:aminoglycoside phosphotransferase (APT) family kinase protein